MNTIVQPFFLNAFGDPLGLEPYVGQSSTSPRDWQFHLQQMEKGGLDTGYQKAVNFGLKGRKEEAELQKRRFWDEFWRMLLANIRDFNKLYDYAVETLLAAEEALHDVHKQIAEEIETIENLETKIDARIEKHGSTSVLRRLKRRLVQDRMELEDRHDELHDYEREVLNPAREDLANKKTLNYKKLLSRVTQIASAVPALLAGPFRRYLEGRERRRTQKEADTHTRPDYTQEWDRSTEYEEPEPV